MSDLHLPVSKFISVWLHERKNPPRKGGERSVSYTLEWVQYGRRQFLSLGKKARKSFAENARLKKEKELNDPTRPEGLVPITFADFQQAYLATVYPGHELPTAQRKVASRSWTKSVSSFRAERLAMGNFQRLVVTPLRNLVWCHELTTADRDAFANRRIIEVESGDSVDADLRNLRTVFNVMEDWNHRPKETNPFAGRKRATVGARRKREMEVASGDKKVSHYTRPQIIALLNQADKELSEQPTDWGLARLRALIYLAAYTGARIGELLHLEWSEIDFVRGVAWLNWKRERGFKTKGAEAPVGLPDSLLVVLREWQTSQRGQWVFPNEKGKPWTTGGPGYRPLDQLQALAQRADVQPATWKMFRHSLNTHGKQWFGLNKEQMRVQLRHEDAATQRHYDHSDLDNLRSAVKNIDYRK